MFIVKKNISGKDYYYLQQSVRKGNKVTSKTVAYLGKTKEEAEKKKSEIEEKMKLDFSEKFNQNSKMKNEKTPDKIIERKPIGKKIDLFLEVLIFTEDFLVSGILVLLGLNYLII